MPKKAFLPADYDLPQDPQKFLRLSKCAEGKIRIRFLTSPIVGYSWWETYLGEDNKEKRRCKRVPEFQQVPRPERADAKAFWLALVLNRSGEESCVQCLELDQRSVMQAIKDLVDPDVSSWGSPVGLKDGYDIVITKTGSGKDTRYPGVTPEPAKPVHYKEFSETDFRFAELNYNLDPEILFGDGGTMLRPKDEVAMLTRDLEHDLTIENLGSDKIPNRVTKEQAGEIIRVAKDLNIPDDQLKGLLAMYHAKTPAKLAASDYEAVIIDLRQAASVRQSGDA